LVTDLASRAAAGAQLESHVKSLEEHPE
jgi:hypothetical protein